MWWNDDVKAVVKRKKAVWKEVRRTRGEDPKEDIGKLTKKKRERLKDVYVKARRR